MSYDLNTPAGADFFVAAIASFREHDRPFARPRTGKDRHLETTITVGPLHVPVAGSLPVLKQECWFSLGFVHLDELTPPPAAPQLGIEMARLGRGLGRWVRHNSGLDGHRIDLRHDALEAPHARREWVAVAINCRTHKAHDFGVFFGG